MYWHEPDLCRERVHTYYPEAVPSLFEENRIFTGLIVIRYIRQFLIGGGKQPVGGEWIDGLVYPNGSPGVVLKRDY